MVLTHFLRKMPLGDKPTVSWSAVSATGQLFPLARKQITASLVENWLHGAGKTHFLRAASAQLIAGEAFRDQRSPCALVILCPPNSLFSSLLFPGWGGWGEWWVKQRRDFMLIRLHIHMIFVFVCLTYFSMRLSRSIHVAANGIILFFFMAE